MDNFESGDPTQKVVVGNSDSMDYEVNRDHVYMGRSPTGLDMSPSSYSEQHGGPDLSENEVGVVIIFGTPIISLFVEGKERLCLAQISNTLLRQFSYNEIHNRRVALGIACMQCTPIQLEILRRLGAMPISSRRCGLITRREAERLVKSFLVDNTPPTLPDNFYFKVYHKCGWGSEGHFLPTRYNSSRAKCIKCVYCNVFFSPNKFIFHFHRTASHEYKHADAANFNSWRKHLHLVEPVPSEDIVHAWEDVKAMFNGGSRKRLTVNHPAPLSSPAKSNTKEMRYIPYSQKENSTNEQIPAPVGEKFTHVVPSFPVNPTLYSPASVEPLIPRTHPAFPKPRVPTSYGEFFRTLSAPYSMWWMKYAPTMAAGYNLNHLPRNPFDMSAQVPHQWPVNLKRMRGSNTSGDDADYKYNDFKMTDQWNAFTLMQPTRTFFTEAGNTEKTEVSGIGVPVNQGLVGSETAAACDYSRHIRDSSPGEKMASPHLSDASSNGERSEFGAAYDQAEHREKCLIRQRDAADVSSTSSYTPPAPTTSIQVAETLKKIPTDDEQMTEDDEEMDKKSLSSRLLPEDQSLSDSELETIATGSTDLERISVEKLRNLLTKAKKLKKRAAQNRKRLRFGLSTAVDEEKNTNLVMEHKLKESQETLNALCSKIAVGGLCPKMSASEMPGSTVDMKRT